MKKISAIGFALLMVFAVFVPAVAANAGDIENKGYLYVDLACRSPQISGEFTATPVIVSATFTNAARVDKGFVDVYVKKVGEPQTFKFLPQGQFDTQAEPGTYLLQMEDANGGQPEYALVAIKAGFKETVVFLGHGISGITEKAKDVITVTEATYGATRVVVDVPAHEHTVVDHEAYYEHAHDHANVPCTHIVPAVPAIPAVPGTPAYYTVVYDHNHGNCDRVYYGSFDFKVGNDKYKFDNHGDYTYTFHPAVETIPAVPAVPAHPQHAFDTVEVPCTHFHAACTHVVQHAAQTHVEGEFVDVKAEVQQALDNGAQTMKFRNDFNPGGIFTPADELIVQIDDPAPGQVKNVHIVFTVNGGEPQTVDTQEYEEFFLG